MSDIFLSYARASWRFSRRSAGLHGSGALRAALVCAGLLVCTGRAGEASSSQGATGQAQQPAKLAIRFSSARTNPKDGLSYVWIPPGEFWMGAISGDSDAQPDEKPRHRVRITKGFWMGDTPVTVAAYKRFLKDRRKQKMPEAPKFNPAWSKVDHPVLKVTWNEAQAYCEWAGGSGGRLPTEAQWEYAARAGRDGSKYTLNYSGTIKTGTSPVRSYLPNAWGLYDMAGSVWGWVLDWYGKDYYSTLAPDKPADDPRGPQSGRLRVLRGGAFSSGMRFLRASSRRNRTPGAVDSSIGFRCVMEVTP